MNTPLTDAQAFRTTDKNLEVVLATFARDLEWKLMVALDDAETHATDAVTYLTERDEALKLAEDYKEQLSQRWSMMSDLEEVCETKDPAEAIKFIAKLKGELEDTKNDRDSWAKEADDRMTETIQALTERNKALERIKELEAMK